VDPNGRFVICDIETNSKLLTLANVYAPNEDDPVFFQAVFGHLPSFHCEEIIIGGDFNLVLDKIFVKTLICLTYGEFSTRKPRGTPGTNG